MKLKTLALASLLLGSCAGPVAYNGPRAAAPFIGVETQPHYDTASDPRHPRWVERSLGFVTNPSMSSVEVDVDCDQTLVRHLEVPARSTQYFLVDPADVVCELHYSR
jgi:hypothetical protein